jgi:hypothetical protein
VRQAKFSSKEAFRKRLKERGRFLKSKRHHEQHRRKGQQHDLDSTEMRFIN